MLVEKPIPPSARDWRSRVVIASISPSVASCPTARSPITYRRIALWPTMKAVLMAILPSRWSRKSPKLRQDGCTASCSEEIGMPSTTESILSR